MKQKPGNLWESIRDVLKQRGHETFDGLWACERHKTISDGPEFCIDCAHELIEELNAMQQPDSNDERFHNHSLTLRRHKK